MTDFDHSQRLDAAQYNLHLSNHLIETFAAYHLLCMLQGQQFYPLSFPRIPQEEILDNLALQKIVLELASTLEVGMLFHTTEELN